MSFVRCKRGKPECGDAEDINLDAMHWKDEAAKLARDNMQLVISEEDAQKYALKMKEENKRLRKALEEIANGHLQELVSEQIAKLALKEVAK